MNAIKIRAFGNLLVNVCDCKKEKYKCPVY